jgi:hypothetical protein
MPGAIVRPSALAVLRLIAIADRKKAFFLIATSAATSPVPAGCASLKFCGVFFALNVQWNGSANTGRCRLPLREAELGRATYQVRWLLNDFEFDLRDATFGHS